MDIISQDWAEKVSNFLANAYFLYTYTWRAINNSE